MSCRSVTVASEKTNEIKDISSNYNDFSLRIALMARDSLDPNYIISPLGVAFNLSITLNGAEGLTKKEILDVLNIKESGSAIKDVNNFCGFLYDELNTGGAYMRTSYWINNGFKVKPEFLNTCRQTFHAPVYERKLSSVATMREVNEWVEENTRGMIKNFLDFPFSDDQVSALLNTIYVRAKWDSPFLENETRKASFKNYDNTTGQCDMMERDMVKIETRRFDNFNIYRFSLDSARYCMDIILPDTGVSIDDCKSAINASMFTDWDKNKKSILFDMVKMPKWDIQTKFYFKKSLEKLGLTSLFHPTRANLSGISDNISLFIYDILQKARFIADERGAEAAASTCDMMVGAASFAPRKPKNLVFDRPFVYLLTDRSTDTIIFIGEIRKF